MALVLLNPASGNRSALAFYQSHVSPLLNSTHVVLRTTEYPGHAQALIDPATSSVILLSGDGTLHEMLGALTARDAPLKVALIPCGTANALYASLFPPGDVDANDVSYKLQSLASYLGGGHTIPLALAATTLDERTITSCVVVSTSLHALILRDSEALRNEHPGVERFKLAAQQNSAKWYKARLRLWSENGVQVYDPEKHDFVGHSDAVCIKLEGPFAYFLSTVNVDRLEPAFRITPLARAIPPSRPLYDIVVVRPSRDPSVSSDDSEAREAYSAKMWKILGGAYADGAHINQRYNSDGEIVDTGDGPVVVEYLRCDKWEWIPVRRVLIGLVYFRD